LLYGYAAENPLLLTTMIIKAAVKFIGFFLLLQAPLLSFSQLCQGSLGDPIVNKTFGAGANPGLPLSAAATNYQFLNADCPNDGFYTVRNNTSNCFSTSWHTLTADHTGDPNGYFMLVNASVQPGAFYIDTVRGLCSGTTFEFAAWVVNVMRPTACGGNGNRPNLTFLIERTDGTILQQYTTGDIAQQSAPVWQQYGFFFTTPAGVTDVVLRIVNNAPGGCGNDLALDDITFRPCGPQLVSSFTGFSSDTLTVCEQTASNFSLAAAISSGYSNPVFQWQTAVNGNAFTDIPGATAQTLNVNIPAGTPPGVYKYRVLAAEAGNMTSTGCRVSSAAVTLIVEALPVFTINSNAPVCANSNLQLNVSGNAPQYQWTGPSAFTGNGSAVVIPGAQTTNSGRYYVTASTLAGCLSRDSIDVVVHPSPVATINLPVATICEEDTISLLAGGGSGYLWQPATALSSPNTAATLAYPSASTLYSVIVENTFNCRDTVTAEITVRRKPAASAGPDLFTLAGVPVRVMSTAGGDNISTEWLPPANLDNPFTLQPLFNAPAGGTYTYRLLVTSLDGCGTAWDEVTVLVLNKLFIPTGFTPQGDGKNDKWAVLGLSVYPDAVVSIYDRAGQPLLLQQKNFTGWDGRYKGQELPTGTYVYLIDLKTGKPGDLLKGTVTLIR
jgi:gliding motility-associated-like protein